MRNITKIILAVIAALTALLQVPAVAEVVTAFLALHPSIGTIVLGIATALATLHAPAKKE